MFWESCQIITLIEKELMIRKRLQDCVSFFVVLLLAGCQSMTSYQMEELDQLAKYSIMKLKGERSEDHGLFHTAPAYVAATIDWGSLVEGFRPNGALVQQSEYSLNQYLILDQLTFDGAGDVMKFNIVILLSESDLAQALDGELKIQDAVDRRVYFYAREKRFTVYPLHSFRIRLVED
jgi:hypothetical protein